jgi:hypothetical protein
MWPDNSVPIWQNDANGIHAIVVTRGTSNQECKVETGGQGSDVYPQAAE